MTGWFLEWDVVPLYSACFDEIFDETMSGMSADNRERRPLFFGFQVRFWLFVSSAPGVFRYI